MKKKLRHISFFLKQKNELFVIFFFYIVFFHFSHLSKNFSFSMLPPSSLYTSYFIYIFPSKVCQMLQISQNFQRLQQFLSSFKFPIILILWVIMGTNFTFVFSNFHISQAMCRLFCIISFFFPASSVIETLSD